MTELKYGSQQEKSQNANGSNIYLYELRNKSLNLFITQINIDVNNLREFIPSILESTLRYKGSITDKTYRDLSEIVTREASKKGLDLQKIPITIEQAISYHTSGNQKKLKEVIHEIIEGKKEKYSKY